MIPVGFFGKFSVSVSVSVEESRGCRLRNQGLTGSGSLEIINDLVKEVYGHGKFPASKISV
jgi:hypothetical protein